MSHGEDSARPVAIVIGSGEVGSAIAVVLHRAGCAVVLCDDVDPAWMRRGMAFTNAWYLGNAELDGEAAVFCASVKSIPAVLDRPGLLAATTWSWGGVAAALDAIALVDATFGAGAARPSSRWQAHDDLIRIVVGSAVEGDGAREATVRLSPTHGHDEHVAVVRAARSGRFATARRIGDRVREGEVVGAIGTLVVVAPQDGVLRGISARGARIREGAEIVEVDARADPVRCFGLSEAGAAAGRAVREVLASRGFIAVDGAGGDELVAVGAAPV
jgi:xanthine dehydrogenase accessory factor